MPYKIVFLDIDGTLLQPDHTICQTTRNAIKKLQRKDVLVFFATGRAVHEIHDLAADLNINSFIGYNGSYALHNDQPIVNEPLEDETILQFVSLAEKLDHEVVFYTNGQNYFTAPHAETTKKFKSVFELQHNGIFTEDIAGDVLGTTIMKVNPEERAQYEFNSEIYLAQGNVEGFEHSYDVIRKQVNKGSAVEAVLKELKIPAEKAVAFGDGTNDKEMFQTVGASVVMDNGHKDVFPYAKYRTSSNAEAGIYNGLKKIGLID